MQAANCELKNRTCSFIHASISLDENTNFGANVFVFRVFQFYEFIFAKDFSFVAEVVFVQRLDYFPEVLAQNP